MPSRSILDILRQDLNPELWPNGHPPLLVAEPCWQQMRKRTSLPIVPRKRKGPRNAVRNFTFGGLIAKWPHDELIESRVPLLILALNGVNDYCCGDYMIQIPAGQAILVPSGVPRRTGAASLADIADNPQRFSDNILFAEHCGSLQIWVNHDRGNHHYRSDPSGVFISNNNRLVSLLSEMETEALSKNPYHQQIINHLLATFLWTLQRCARENKAIAVTRLAYHEADIHIDYAPIPKAQQYVREHLNEQLTLDKIARVARLSRTQFIRQFREETGQTFNEFTTSCRLEQAKVLLRETDFTIDFIHRSLGYKSLQHFNDIFHKKVGMLPSQFRICNKETDTNAP